MEILNLGLKLLLKLFDLFGIGKSERDQYEKDIKKATADYEATATDSANVRQSHQETKSKLREAWEKRWGSQSKKDQNT